VCVSKADAIGISSGQTGNETGPSLKDGKIKRTDYSRGTLDLKKVSGFSSVVLEMAPTRTMNVEPSVMVILPSVSPVAPIPPETPM
jgi:hypothetical protein